MSDEPLRKGWKIGSAKDLLDLSVREEAFEIRRRLAEGFKARRQPTVALKPQCRGPSNQASRVLQRWSLGIPPLHVRSLLALGMSGRELAAIIAIQG